MNSVDINPSKWGNEKLGNLFKERNERGFPEKNVLSATQGKGIIPYDLLEKYVVRDSRNLINYKLVKKGDFVISLRSFEGGFEYSNYEGIISPAYVVLEKVREIDDGFFRHLFKSNVFLRKIQGLLNNNLRDGKSISYNQAKELLLFFPADVEDQRLIANSLNSIEDIIHACNKKINILKEHKSGLMQRFFQD